MANTYLFPYQQIVFILRYVYHLGDGFAAQLLQIKLPLDALELTPPAQLPLLLGGTLNGEGGGTASAPLRLVQVSYYSRAGRLSPPYSLL